jgi:hypothetical protein
MGLGAILRRMVIRFLTLLLATGLVAFATPRILIDNTGYAQLTHVEDAGPVVLGEGIDDTDDKRFVLSLRAVIESIVQQLPAIDILPIHRSLQRPQASGLGLQIYVLNCKIII